MALVIWKCLLECFSTTLAKKYPSLEHFLKGNFLLNINETRLANLMQPENC